MGSVGQWLVWIAVGLIGGSLASRIVTWNRDGFGRWRNLGLGLIGALVGGLVFRLFDWLSALDGVAVSLRDIVSSIAGSLLVLLLFGLSRRSGKVQVIGAELDRVREKGSAAATDETL